MYRDSGTLSRASNIDAVSNRFSCSDRLLYPYSHLICFARADCSVVLAYALHCRDDDRYPGFYRFDQVVGDRRKIEGGTSESELSRLLSYANQVHKAVILLIIMCAMTLSLSSVTHAAYKAPAFQKRRYRSQEQLCSAIGYGWRGRSDELCTRTRHDSRVVTDA